MDYTFIFVAIASVIAILAIYFRLSHNSFNYTVTKILASACFLILAFVAIFENVIDPTYSLFILLGLLFGMLGDIYLGIKEIAPSHKKKLVPCGIIAFLLGHIFYIIAFFVFCDFNYIVLLCALGLSFLALLMFIVLKYKKNKLLLALLTLYAFLEAYACCQAGYLYSLATENTGVLILFIGIILFCLSDSVLSYLYFGPKTTKKDNLILFELVTYYSAQILIAFSLYFI